MKVTTVEYLCFWAPGQYRVEKNYPAT